MMWTARTKNLSTHRGLQFTIDRDLKPLTVSEALASWSSDEAFCSMFNSLLADIPYCAFRWETPAITSSTLAKPFEFVVLDDPDLDQTPDPKAFVEHFDPGADVAVFGNFRQDATLIVPCPLVDSAAYGHLAAFVRLAPASQQQALWAAVGQAMTQRVASKPVWLSTAGAGVAWLHVRLDDRPKYYGFARYQ